MSLYGICIDLSLIYHIPPDFHLNEALRANGFASLCSVKDIGRIHVKSMGFEAKTNPHPQGGAGGLMKKC